MFSVWLIEKDFRCKTDPPNRLHSFPAWSLHLRFASSSQCAKLKCMKLGFLYCLEVSLDSTSLFLIFAGFNCVMKFRWIQLCCFWYSLDSTVFGTFAGFNFVCFWYSLDSTACVSFCMFVVDLWPSLHSVVVDLHVGCDDHVACVWRLLFIEERKRWCVNSQRAYQKVKLSVTWSCLPWQSSELQWTWAM